MESVEACIENHHLIYSAGVVGHFEKVFCKSGYSLAALSGELNGIDFNLPPSKSSVSEKAKLLLKLIEAPSHNVSTNSLMSIAVSFAVFSFGAATGETIEGFLANLKSIIFFGFIIAVYSCVTGFRSGVRQRLVQALHILAEMGEADENQEGLSKGGACVCPRCRRYAHRCPRGNRPRS